MSEIRMVHEVLFSRKLKRPLVAFIQHGRSETGYTYEVICPYCTLTIGQIAEELKEDGPVEMGKAQLTESLREHMKIHLPKCTDSWTRVKVAKTKVPLNTEKLIKEM